MTLLSTDQFALLFQPHIWCNFTWIDQSYQRLTWIDSFIIVIVENDTIYDCFHLETWLVCACCDEPVLTVLNHCSPLFSYRPTWVDRSHYLHHWAWHRLHILLHGNCAVSPDCEYAFIMLRIDDGIKYGECKTIYKCMEKIDCYSRITQN